MRTRIESVWVEVLGRWIPTGHVIGTSDAELAIEVVTAECAKWDLLYQAEYNRNTYWSGMAERAKEKGRKDRLRLYRKHARRARRKLLKIDAVRREWRMKLGVAQTRVSGERAQRRAELLQRLVGSKAYIVRDQRLKLAHAQMDAVNRATEAAIRKEMQIGGRAGPNRR